MLNQFVVAWQFLTIIPVSRRHHALASEQLARSMTWFPAVGLAVGGLLVGAMWMFETVLSRPVSDGLAILLLIVLTRGLHLDGLADTIDGWGGGRTPERRLAIMRDSRIGAMGAMALIAALGLRYLGFSALPDHGRWLAVASMPLVGRWAMTIGGLRMSYARPEGGMAGPFLDHLKIAHVLMATMFAGIWLVWCFGLTAGLSVLVVSGVVARAIAFLSHRLCGGMTGDVFGLINEAAEITFLIAVPAVLMRR
ncbi:MAG TPA: adenosylcobinamide-GDP ribazoletransferase [Nitrospiraceae bacterium]|nr:adenosylcobinamide-GDP ribazoletransferase [Nitrospiraceae bacterium]